VTRGFKILLITIGALLVLSIISVGVVFAADAGNSTKVASCCINQEACNGYCSSDGGTCDPGDCDEDCPGICNQENGNGIAGSCCYQNTKQNNTNRGFGGCCGGY